MPCFAVFYWREHNQEVDFVVKKGKKIIALEIKSSQHKMIQSGMLAFKERFKPHKLLLIGNHGVSIKEFLTTSVQDLF